MARPDITLRNVKGSALTFNELDQNFSSFYYSASVITVGDSGNKLRLHYSGSDSLDTGFQPNYTEVVLPSAQQGEVTINVPGSDRELIFNNGGSLGADSSLKFTQNNGEGSRLGIGSSPTSTLYVRSTNTLDKSNLTISANSNNNLSSCGLITFEQGGTSIAELGKLTSGQDVTNIDFVSKSPLSLGYSDLEGTTSKKLRVTNDGVAIGDGITANALAPLSVLGNLSVGSNFNLNNTNYIGGNSVAASLLPLKVNGDSINTNGLLLESPRTTTGGHVVIGINTDSNNRHSFSIVRGTQGTFNSTIATFRADGKIGIGNRNPVEALTVTGNISGSGNIQVEGTATIEDIDLHTVSNDVKTLVATAGGTVQYMDAAPIPKGGIIMWSGLIDDIPTGWKFCDGNGQVQVNGITIPDLRNQFIVGSYSDTSDNTYPNVKTGATGGDRNAVVVSHSHTATVNDPGHSHSYTLENPLGSGANGSENGISSFSTPNTSPSQTGITVSISPQGESAVNKNLPPYYALAYIIYVGV